MFLLFYMAVIDSIWYTLKPVCTFFSEQLMELFHCRARRRFSRGLKRKPMALVKRLRKAKKEAGPLEKPEVRSTNDSELQHLNLFILTVCMYMQK